MNKKLRVKWTKWSTWETETVNHVASYNGHRSAWVPAGWFSRETCIPLEGPEQPYKWEWA